MARANLKIVIVGASVTGLSLANILERLDIDYVLLEAHEQIAPQLGASIGLWPNGLRILDQLDCLDAFTKGSSLPDEGHLLIHGKLYKTLQGVSSQYEKRYGYGLCFNDRKVLLEILYDKLQDKTKVLTKKRVVRVESTKSGVRVHTQDGDAVTGDILIGGDGLHSTVRNEMRRMAEEVKPNYFSADEPKRIPIHYRCLFGISKPSPKAPSGIVHASWYKGHSSLASNGPGGRIYWFFFEKLEKTLYYDNTPRYTQADTEDLVRKYHDVFLINDMTLSELVDSAESAILTPLHEWNWEKWHFQRIMILGDAAHKMNPLTGQGGNSCLEDSAAFANVLTAKLDAISGPISSDDIAHIFAETQALRTNRTKLAMDISHQAQKREAFEAPGTDLLVRLMLPILGRDARIEAQSQIIVGAVKVDKLPLPHKPHFVPCIYELPAKPLGDVKLVRWAVAAALAGLSYIASHALRLPVFPSDFSFIGTPFKTEYTGIAGIDFLLTTLVKFFSAAVASGDPAKRIQVIYLAAMLGPTVLIWTVESRRRANTQLPTTRLMTWPSIFAALYQIQGIAKVGPIYYLLSLWTTNSAIYQRTSGRPVDVAIAKALLPAFVLAYVLPTVLMFQPFGNFDVWQNSIAFWQLSPLLVSPLLSIITAIIRISSPSDKHPRELSHLQNRDVPYLLSAYSFAFYVTATAHLAILVLIAGSPALSLFRVFWDLPGVFGPLLGLDASEVIFSFLKYDMAIYTSASLVWCLYSVFEMRRQGYVTNEQAATAALAVVASLFVVGPGAMYAGTWYWRETVISTLSKRSEGNQLE